MNITTVLENIHGYVSQSALFAIFGLICIIFALSSFVLIFHWNRYAIDKSVIITAQVIYFLGGLLILLIGFISVILY